MKLSEHTGTELHKVYLSAEIGEQGEILQGYESDFTVNRVSTGDYLITVNLNNENFNNENLNIEIIKAQVTTTQNSGDFKDMATIESRDNHTLRVLGKKLITEEPIDVSFNLMAEIDITVRVTDENIESDVIDITPRSVAMPSKEEEEIEMVVKSKRKDKGQTVLRADSDGVQMLHGGRGIRVNADGVQINRGGGWESLV